MKISISGKPKHSKKEVRQMLKYFAVLLLGKRLARNISINLSYIPLSKNFWGLCSPDDYEERNHRSFVIFINPKISKRNQLVTLAHEMVHVMQYARGELKMLHGDEYKWMGRKITISDTAYDKMPWEKQARQAEKHLVKMYNDFVISFDR